MPAHSSVVKVRQGTPYRRLATNGGDKCELAGWHRLTQRLLLALLLAQLLACSSSEDPPISAAQAYYFVESLKQVESGGRQLQSANLDEAGLLAALGMLDQGLKLAFQVERDSLDRLDLRLGKNFQRYFIEGVENYRLGIEAGDETQQQEGLRLLARWAEFWGGEGAAITARLEPS
jgi:hypothetical protein